MRCYTFHRVSMSGASAPLELPKRALFKASEVCELIHVQPYVLRTWEAEFPELGIAKSAGAQRVYRREDVEQVARIKHLLLVEGLTLAGARRRLEEETVPATADAPVIEELIGQNARERLTQIKRGLNSILELLAGSQQARELRLTPPPTRPAPRPMSAVRGKAQRSGARKTASARRKR